MNKKYFKIPTQVNYIPKGEEATLGGIAYKDEIICSCCGGVFEADEVEITKIYNDWVDFGYAIVDEQGLI